MSEPWVAVLPGGVEILVPRGLEQITPYVLREQGDWFEVELPFARRLLQPGGAMVDVGANVGVYALSAAERVGSTGQVLALEPASAASDLLRASAERGGYDWLEVEQVALGDTEGQVTLRVETLPELNAVGEGEGERVRQTTLDALLSGWSRLDLLKVDAEGAEVAVLRGGARVLARLDPLVICERIHGDAVNAELIPCLTRELDLGLYRLVPGLDLLIPDMEEPDGFQLNVFACGETRAQTLEGQGLLVRYVAEPAVPKDDLVWQAHLGALPYARSHLKGWSRQRPAKPFRDALRRAVVARIAPDGAACAGHLRAACRELEALCECEPSVPRLHTLARVSAAWGRRELAVATLRRLVVAYDEDPAPPLDEAFMVCWPGYDLVDPAGDHGRWGLAAALEALETLQHHSSYWTKGASRARLERLAGLDYPSEAMDRRRDVLGVTRE